MKTDDMYLVIISGHEGIENIFGFYSEEEAVKRAIELKANAPKEEWGKSYTSEEFNELLEKANKLGHFMPFTKDQVCIMGKAVEHDLDDPPLHKDSITCRCDLLPDEWRNEEAWLR